MVRPFSLLQQSPQSVVTILPLCRPLCVSVTNDFVSDSVVFSLLGPLLRLGELAAEAMRVLEERAVVVVPRAPALENRA